MYTLFHKARQKRITSIKNLRIIIDEHLNWKKHNRN